MHLQDNIYKRVRKTDYEAGRRAVGFGILSIDIFLEEPRDGIKLALLGIAFQYSVLACGTCLRGALFGPPGDTGVTHECYSNGCPEEQHVQELKTSLMDVRWISADI